MIDDLRIFKRQSEWGVGIYIEEIEQKLKNINPFYKFYYENGWEENDILIAKI
jgi:ABC-type Fe3+-hydroxamate transport system substrate-binding protein